MEDEYFNDLLVRYSYVHSSRLTEKQKNRFLKSFIQEIAQIRQDIKVIEYDATKKGASRNVYVGDFSQAERVICTYYDTPPKHTNSYRLFDFKEQGRRTTKFILFASICMLLVGLVGLATYIKLPKTIYTNVGVGLFSFAYFYLFNRIVKGNVFQHSLVRNTSSVITLLMWLRKSDKKTAYAFIDDGCYGTRGLDVLKESLPKKTNIFYLDSIGAEEQLYVSGNEFDRNKLTELAIEQVVRNGSVNYVYSAKKITGEEQVVYELSPHRLKQKHINKENIQKAHQLLN